MFLYNNNNNNKQFYVVKKIASEEFVEATMNLINHFTFKNVNSKKKKVQCSRNFTKMFNYKKKTNKRKSYL